MNPLYLTRYHSITPTTHVSKCTIPNLFLTQSTLPSTHTHTPTSTPITLLLTYLPNHPPSNTPPQSPSFQHTSPTTPTLIPPSPHLAGIIVSHQDVPGRKVPMDEALVCEVAHT